MTYSEIALAEVSAPLWFCLKAQPKREHIAAAGLRKIDGVETFAPQIRFRKATRRGPVWFSEALFPGYLFARFPFSALHRLVRSVPGVTSLVHFGDRLAVVDAVTIQQLVEASGEQEVIVIDPAHAVGDEVEIANGPFRGLGGVLTMVNSSAQRVKVLMEFLGREIEAELLITEVLSRTQARMAGIPGRATAPAGARRQGLQNGAAMRAQRGDARV